MFVEKERKKIRGYAMNTDTGKIQYSKQRCVDGNSNYTIFISMQFSKEHA